MNRKIIVFKENRTGDDSVVKFTKTGRFVLSNAKNFNRDRNRLHVIFRSLIQRVGIGRIYRTESAGNQKNVPASESDRTTEDLSRSNGDIRGNDCTFSCAAPSEGISTLPPRLIFLVDDEISLLDMFRSMIEDILKYCVRTFDNGPDALHAVEKQDEHPDLLITDIVMPKMKGSQLALRMRKTIPDLGVIFISGCTFNALDGHENSFPRSIFLQKPCSMLQLTSAIRTILR